MSVLLNILLCGRIPYFNLFLWHTIVEQHPRESFYLFIINLYCINDVYFI